MKRVIKVTEKDIDKIIELIDNRIEVIKLAIKNYTYAYDNELEELKNIREKLRPLDVK